MIEDPGARRQRRPAIGPWIILALLVGLAILTAVAVLRPARQFEAAAPAEAALTTRQQVAKDQAKFAASETARNQP
jgi:hypothetical protein